MLIGVFRKFAPGHITGEDEKHAKKQHYRGYGIVQEAAKNKTEA